MERFGKLQGPRMPRSGDDRTRRPLHGPRPERSRTGDDSADNTQSRRPGELRGPRMPKNDVVRRAADANRLSPERLEQNRPSSPESIADWMTLEQRAQRRFDKSSADSPQPEMRQSSAGRGNERAQPLLELRGSEPAPVEIVPQKGGEHVNERAQPMPELGISESPRPELGHEEREKILGSKEYFETRISDLANEISQVGAKKHLLQGGEKILTARKAKLDAQDRRLTEREKGYTEFAEYLDTIRSQEHMAMEQVGIYNEQLGSRLNPQARREVEKRLAGWTQRVKNCGQRRSDLTHGWNEWKKDESMDTYKLGKRDLNQALQDEYKDNEQGREDLEAQRQILNDRFDSYRELENRLNSSLKTLEEEQLTIRMQLTEIEIYNKSDK
jgi:hypothetical protein